MPEVGVQPAYIGERQERQHLVPPPVRQRQPRERQQQKRQRHRPAVERQNREAGWQPDDIGQDQQPQQFAEAPATVAQAGENAVGQRETDEAEQFDDEEPPEERYLVGDALRRELHEKWL